MCGADAIHPGYGLLSENPDFVDACEAAGIAFIGPKAETMRALGDKASARRVAIEAGVPVIPATEVLGDDMKAIAKEAEEIGYPLMLKASWGGGGRGMRPINGPEELEEKVREGRREAEAAFGNGEGYLEKMILRARHVEVQILGDSTATSTTSTSATAPSSGATRRSWNARPPPISPPSARSSAFWARRSANT
jgi:pyruvate carboxylase